MIGALLGASFLIGMIAGWFILPALVVAALLYWTAGIFSARLLALALVVVVLGVLRAPDPSLDQLNPSVRSFDHQQVQVVDGVVDDGRRQRFRIRRESGDTLCVDTYARQNIGRDDRVTLDFESDAPDDMTPGTAAWLSSQDCHWSGEVNGITIQSRGSSVMRRVDDLRQSITRQFVEWVPGDRGALLAGLVIGDESLLSYDARQAFLQTGSLHVVAVSGSNLTLLAAILVLVFGWIPRRWMNEIFALAMVWVYVTLAGASPPTLRAGMIAAAGAGARLLGRPTDYLTLSITIAAIQVAILPHTLSGLSFRLTTVAIIVVALTIAGRKFNTFWSALGLAVLTTAAIQLALLPLLPPESRPNVVVAVLANVAIAPFITLAFVTGLVGIIISPVLPPVGEALAIIGGEVNHFTLWIVESLAAWNSPSWMNPRIQSPEWLIVLIAYATVALVSKEFHRSARSAWMSLEGNRIYMAPLILGIGIGTLAGWAAVAILH